MPSGELKQSVIRNLLLSLPRKFQIEACELMREAAPLIVKGGNYNISIILKHNITYIILISMFMGNTVNISRECNHHFCQKKAEEFRPGRSLSEFIIP